jgi:beta-N-acetylhexosaminidase
VRRLSFLIAGLLAVGLVACAPGHGSAARTPSSSTPTPTPTPTVDPIAGLSLPQRVGQLFMVGTGTGAPDPVTMAAIVDRHAGSIFLHGHTVAGADAMAALVARFTALVGPASTGGIPLWVATDQEGGDVQVLAGPGLDAIPSALEQGREDPATLQAQAQTWGRQLRSAGVNMNLAPVADIVTSPQTARGNPPIGELDREYGFDEASVATHAGAFADGMRAAGVMPTFKHFPGLGHVGANTDYRSGVRDTTVTPDSPDVDVYRELVASGPSVVMISTAVYQQIDPNAPAAFSPAVVTGVLRDSLGFSGVVITDDVSTAAQVRAWSPADRAILAIEAGVDIVLVSADPGVFAPMYDAVLARAQADPVFAAKVDAAARRIVTAKLAPSSG